jgi:flagellar protein FliT
MSLAFQRLQDTGSALRVALVNQDWAAIGELDRQCRQAVDEAMVEAGDDEHTLTLRMQELLDLYRDLVELCQAEQQRVAQELRQINQSRQGAKIYQLLG